MESADSERACNLCDNLLCLGTFIHDWIENDSQLAALECNESLFADSFIDLCILLGCDYCDSVKGVGPAKAITLIRQYRSIEEIMKHTKKLNIPEKWPYKGARHLFEEPEVNDPTVLKLKWHEPDEDELVRYLVEEKGFSEDRIRNGAKKLQKSKQKSTQGRLDMFFKPIASPIAGQKRKSGDDKGPLKKKSKQTASTSVFRQRK